MWSVSLHAFGYASKDRVAAAVYAVFEQEKGTTSKYRTVKRNLTISRLELVAGHMVSNLITNVETVTGNEKERQCTAG